MRLVPAFLRLIRWPNLVFIILTQLLLYYCVYLPLFQQPEPLRLFWIITASVCIAAAGYIINDYFDLNIDQINKPNKNVFAGVIRRRWAILWHWLLSGAGVLATVAALGLKQWYLIVANLACVVLLWFYSTSFKRQLLIGNVIISLLTAWTVIIIFFAFAGTRYGLTTNDPEVSKFFRVSFLYGAFAFIASLIREAVKDVEDLEGDRRYRCKTLPIVAGLNATRIYIGIWTVVLLAAIAMLQIYVIRFEWWPAIAYSILCILFPLFLILRLLVRAQTKEEFNKLSSLSKLVMLTGILSLFFFRLYF